MSDHQMFQEISLWENLHVLINLHIVLVKIDWEAETFDEKKTSNQSLMAHTATKRILGMTALPSQKSY